MMDLLNYYYFLLTGSPKLDHERNTCYYPCFVPCFLFRTGKVRVLVMSILVFSAETSIAG